MANDWMAGLAERLLFTKHSASCNRFIEINNMDLILKDLPTSLGSQIAIIGDSERCMWGLQITGKLSLIPGIGFGISILCYLCVCGGVGMLSTVCCLFLSQTSEKL